MIIRMLLYSMKVYVLPKVNKNMVFCKYHANVANIALVNAIDHLLLD